VSKDGSSDEGATPSGPSSASKVRPARSRRLERLLESGPRVTSRSWVQLVLFVVLLVGLFLARDEFGRRAAGCYGQVAPADGAKEKAPPDEMTNDPGTFAPIVEIRRAPAP